MTKDNEEIKAWCTAIAEVIVDELWRGELVEFENFESAVDVVSEELFVRLIVGDYPPPCKPKLLGGPTSNAN